MLPISCMAENSISENPSCCTMSPMILWRRRLALPCSTRNIMLPVISPSTPRKTPTITCSSPPINAPTSLKSKSFTCGTFISTLQFSIWESAVIALPAPMLPISFKTSRYVSETFSKLRSPMDQSPLCIFLQCDGIQIQQRDQFPIVFAYTCNKALFALSGIL